MSQFTVDELLAIWIPRAKRSYYRQGDAPIPAFNYDAFLKQPNHPDITTIVKFQPENWSDPALVDLREFLADLDFGLHQTKDYTIFHDVTHDQHYYFISSDQFAQNYLISHYKQRGKIDSMIGAEYGTLMTLEDITALLITLGLETLPNRKDD